MNAVGSIPVEPAASPFAGARGRAVQVESIDSRADMFRKPHSEIEEILEEAGRDRAREMLASHLELRAAAEQCVEVVGADGVDRTRNRAIERQLGTVLGEVTVQRLAYQAVGSPDLHPLDASLKLSRER